MGPFKFANCFWYHEYDRDKVCNGNLRNKTIIVEGFKKKKNYNSWNELNT